MSVFTLFLLLELLHWQHFRLAVIYIFLPLSLWRYVHVCILVYVHEHVHVHVHVCVYLLQTNDLLLKFPLHLHINEGLCWNFHFSIFTAIITACFSDCKANSPIYFLLYIVEINARRLAYVCENVQEELKLESKYKKMWVVISTS